MYKVIKINSDLALFQDDLLLIKNEVRLIIDYLGLDVNEATQFCRDLQLHERCVSDFGINGAYIYTRGLL